jgi:hypothetical protein
MVASLIWAANLSVEISFLNCRTTVKITCIRNSEYFGKFCSKPIQKSEIWYCNLHGLKIDYVEVQICRPAKHIFSSCSRQIFIDNFRSEVQWTYSYCLCNTNLIVIPFVKKNYYFQWDFFCLSLLLWRCNRHWYYEPQNRNKLCQIMFKIQASFNLLIEVVFLSTFYTTLVAQFWILEWYIYKHVWT